MKKVRCSKNPVELSSEMSHMSVRDIYKNWPVSRYSITRTWLKFLIAVVIIIIFFIIIIVIIVVIIITIIIVINYLFLAGIMYICTSGLLAGKKLIKANY